MAHFKWLYDMKYLMFVFMFVLLADVNISLGNDYCSELLLSSKSKIDSLDSYCYKVGINSVLFPDSSPVLSKTKITTNIKVCVKSVGNKIVGSELSDSKITTYFFNIIPNVENLTLNAVWDGDFIYECCRGENGIKMVDVPKNRGAIYVPYFLSELSQRNNLRHDGDKVINGIECYILSGTDYVLSDWLLIEGESKIAIDKNTGFPVRIWGEKGKSKTSVAFEEVERNIVINDDIFTPSPGVNYKFFRGME